jgi:hypothetical protein
MAKAQFVESHPVESGSVNIYRRWDGRYVFGYELTEDFCGASYATYDAPSLADARDYIGYRYHNGPEPNWIDNNLSDSGLWEESSFHTWATDGSPV